jgi:asparagine synthase (glutamine-hydrolysing)
VARPWLRAAVQEELARRDAADAAVPALHAGRSAWQSVHRTAVQRMFATHRALGQEIDVDYVAPFAHPEFVAALAAEAGFWGWSGRTQAMRRLFGDVLPDAVLARTSKAYFNGAVFTERTRAFAAQWDGSGVDTDLVDPESLREIWLSELPDGRTMALLQQAWLHSTRVAA